MKNLITLLSPVAVVLFVVGCGGGGAPANMPEAPAVPSGVPAAAPAMPSGMPSAVPAAPAMPSAAPSAAPPKH